jgi:hypothetical protein
MMPSGLYQNLKSPKVKIESSKDNNKESREPDYDDDEKSDKVGEEKQEQDTGEITTVNQVF